MSVTIRIFQVEEKCFKHVMSSYHDKVELRDEDDKALLTYSNDAKVFDQNGHLGNFSIDFIDGRPRCVYYAKGEETCTDLGPDMLTATVEFSKRYLRQLV